MVYRTGSADEGKWKPGQFIIFFLPTLIRRAMRADADAAIEAFGNEEGHQT